MKPTLSIITVNYNSAKETMDFLKSICGNPLSTAVEVIVVDNSQTKGLRKDLWKIESTIKYVGAEGNLGYAGGMNLGMKHASGDYLFLVNNDTTVDVSQLLNLVAQYRQSGEYGILCPVIKNEDNSVQYAGYTMLNPFTARNKTITKVDYGKDITETAYPHGAAMLISRENLDRVGYLSEEYFLYYEEIDWGQRVRNQGLKIGVFNKCHITHAESGSVNKVSQCKLYFTTRNRILFARNHFHKAGQFFFTIYMLMISIPKGLKLLINHNFESLQTFFAAYKWHLFNTRFSKELGNGFDALR
jgi:GT2 family glycosyltransferase